MIHQLCEAYGWSYAEAMKMTLPQIIMLGHAAHITHERIRRKVEANRDSDKAKIQVEEEDPIVFNGKRLSQLTTSEMVLYYGGWEE